MYCIYVDFNLKFDKIGNYTEKEYNVRSVLGIHPQTQIYLYNV